MVSYSLPIGSVPIPFGQLMTATHPKVVLIALNTGVVTVSIKSIEPTDTSLQDLQMGSVVLLSPDWCRVMQRFCISSINNQVVHLTHRLRYSSFLSQSVVHYTIQAKQAFFIIPKLNMSSKNEYTDPELREEVKEEVKAGNKGGAPGQWSARKVTFN